MPQESSMQFADSHVSDDSTNGRTVVENVKEVASADYSSETEDGMYLIPDGEGAVIEPASEDKVEVTADGVKTYATLLNEIATEMDFSKVRDNAYLEVILTNGNKNISVLRANYGTSVAFFQGLSESTGARIRTYYIEDSKSQFEESTGSSYSDKSTTKPTNGTVIRLYYGNKKAVVDLQTTANRCWTLNGDTVENRLTWKEVGHTTGSTAIALPSAYSELLIHVRCESIYWNYTFYIISANPDGYYRSGYKDVCYTTIQKDNGNISLTEYFEINVDRTSEGNISVYYR